MQEGEEGEVEVKKELRQKGSTSSSRHSFSNDLYR